LKLTFATDDMGVARGTIFFGQGTPPPPATDPNVGYPADFLDQTRANGYGSNEGWVYIADGYGYAFEAGSFEAQRLQFTVSLAQLWSDWCALQASPGPGFGPCFTTTSGARGSTLSADLQVCTVTNYDHTQDLVVDCSKLLMCDGFDICMCTTSGCGTGNAGAAFDLFMTGTTMSGSVRMARGTYDVHFVKD
jgi:hypothetical protein